MSTTQLIWHILITLTGGCGDEDLLEITKQLIAWNKDGTFLVCSPLIRKPLQQIAQSHPALRELYIKMILLLPIQITIPSDDARNLISLLKNPDATIVGAASQIITHFTANDKFRHYFLQTEIWYLFTVLIYFPTRMGWAP
ncbi:hypothetical protein B0H19DRAFT_1272020 [Mycena capillaripes]|nr:hypothetical protein B0H19DRAFT_1272020 [Mycena capillaripes]